MLTITALARNSKYCHRCAANAGGRRQKTFVCGNQGGELSTLLTGVPIGNRHARRFGNRRALEFVHFFRPRQQR